MVFPGVFRKKGQGCSPKVTVGKNLDPSIATFQVVIIRGCSGQVLWTLAIQITVSLTAVISTLIKGAFD